MRYVVAQEIKSETRVGKSIYLFDLFFVIIYFSVSYVFASAVHEMLKLAFYVFSLACALFLTAKSHMNRKRRNYESIILFLRKDREVYHPVPHKSKATQQKETEGLFNE